MKLPIKVLLSYLGLGVGCLGTYAAVSVFDNKQIEDVVEDYEKEEESTVIVADSPKPNSKPIPTEVVVEPSTPRSAPLVASSDTQTKPAKATAQKAKASKPRKRRDARALTIEKVGKGGPKAWEKFTELTKQFLGIR